MMDVINWVLMNYQAVLAGVVAVLAGVTAVAMVVPGEEPEKTLKKITDFLSKWSVK